MPAFSHLQTIRLAEFFNVVLLGFSEYVIPPYEARNQPSGDCKSIL